MNEIRNDELINDWIGNYTSGNYSVKDKYLHNIPIQVENYLKKRIKKGTYELYRGMSFTKKNFNKWVEKNVLKFSKFETGGNITLNINQISSWTTDLQVVKYFTENEEIDIILYIKIDESKIFADFRIENRNEQEILLKPGIYKCKIFEMSETPYNVDNFNKRISKNLGGSSVYPESGMYIGTDDIQRYIKFYKNPLQCLTENLSNKIYKEFGILVPKSSIGIENGKVYVANELILGDKINILTPKISKEILEGIVVDILLSNWDVLGTGYENLIQNKNGIYRIDNGGSLLFRAQGKMKPENLLNEITEWDNFTIPNINYEYSKVFEMSEKKNICESDFVAILQNIYNILLL